MRKALFSLPTLAFAAVLVLGGCEDNGVGRLCDVGVDGGTSTSESIINGAALECPSRICLAAVPNSPTVPGGFAGEQPLCTLRCSNDDDCSDGLTSKADMRLCHSSFKCAVSTTTGPFCCEKLCICADFLAS